MDISASKDQSENIDKKILLCQKKIAKVNSEINKHVYGQENVIEQIIISLLCSNSFINSILSI